MFTPFNFARNPNIMFGIGTINELYKLIPKFGSNILFVIGGKSLKKSGKWNEITSEIEDHSFNYSTVSISSEPSPAVIDSYTDEFRSLHVDLVVSIGGGSVIDSGKAISAMIPKNTSIRNYLEGVGSEIHDGEKIPFIAIPTTSGTGSEATKNAVISEVGSNGFKKSLRHNNLVPNYAIIDPELLISSPPKITSTCGMDAFTQLLESYVSTKANPMTDTLALSGIKSIGDNLELVSSNEGSNLDVRAAMAYGSLISGITLSNAGLGIVHGLASSIGGLFEIPHGVVCGTLLAEATKMNIYQLKKKGSIKIDILKKHAKVGALLHGSTFNKDYNVDDYCSILVEILEQWIQRLNIDRLGKYGIRVQDLEGILEKTSLKNNPVNLSKDNIKRIIQNRI